MPWIIYANKFGMDRRYFNWSIIWSGSLRCVSCIAFHSFDISVRWTHVLSYSNRISTLLDIANVIQSIECKNRKNLRIILHCAGEILARWHCNPAAAAHIRRVHRALSFWWKNVLLDLPRNVRCSFHSRSFWFAFFLHQFSRCRYPFNEQTLLGYPIALLMQCSAAFCVFVCYVPIVCLFVGSCWLISSFVEDLTTELSQHFNVDEQFWQNSATSKPADITNHFIQIIKFHVDAKKLSLCNSNSSIWKSLDLNNEFGRSFQNYRWHQLDLSIHNTFDFHVVHACAVLIVDCHSNRNGKSIEKALLNFIHEYVGLRLFFHWKKKMNFSSESLYIIITSFVVLFWACFFVFFACEGGTVVCTKFAGFDYELWQCLWYQFPMSMQRLFVLVMSNTQHPAMLYSYGNFECTRDSFKRVILASSHLKIKFYHYPN